jgi:hypothetical protein
MSFHVAAGVLLAGWTLREGPTKKLEGATGQARPECPGCHFLGLRGPLGGPGIAEVLAAQADGASGSESNRPW